MGQIVQQIADVEAAKAQAEAFKHNPETEHALREQAAAMESDGLSWSDELASFLGSNGEHVSKPAEDWAAAQGLSMKGELQRYMGQLRGAVTAEVLQPMGIDAEHFVAWLEESGMHRARAVKATLASYHLKTLQGFVELARDYAATGQKTKRQARQK
jgi:hypothetical protein